MIRAKQRRDRVESCGEHGPGTARVISALVATRGAPGSTSDPSEWGTI